MMPVLLPWTDMRPSWDAKDPELDKRESEIERNLKIAIKLGDGPAIDELSSHLADVRKTRAAYVEARKKLDADMDARSAARRELDEAQAKYARGTPDPKAAIKNHEAFVVAEARFRHFDVPMAQTFASVHSLRSRVSVVAFSGLDKNVIEETTDLVNRLFTSSRIEGAFMAADEAGRRSKASHVLFWGVAEHLAREAFDERLAREKADEKGGRIMTPSGTVVDHRYEPRKFPTKADVDTLFNRRRAAFEAERRRLEAALASMRGELSSMGGDAT